MILVENYNRTFPKYPRLLQDAGWIHGVWYCGTSWRRTRLHGAYPPGFLDRALSLWPGLKVLHCPSGTVTGPGVTVDRVQDEVRQPMILADAGRLPFKDGSFGVVLADPPYSAGDSRKYGCAPFPIDRFMREAHRVLQPGGYLGMLHVSYPQCRRADWDLRGLIAVVTGFRRATRMFSIFRSRKGEAGIGMLCWLCKARIKGKPRWWPFGDLRTERTVCGRCHGALFRVSRSDDPKARARDLKKVMGHYVRNAAE